MSDDSCPGVTGGSVALDALFVPENGSPALRGGDPDMCRSGPVNGVDLAFQFRQNPAACALGAFERAPVTKLAQGRQVREPHASSSDDFPDSEGYKPPPARPVSTEPTSPQPPPTTTAAPPSDLFAALRGTGIDYSVSQAEIRDWLSDGQYTPYPAIATSLLRLLASRHLRQPVYLDVIVWNYEHGPGASSPRRTEDVDPARVQAAMVAGYNERHGTTVHRFEDLLQ